MDVFHRIFGNLGESHFQESYQWKSLNQRLQNYLFVYLYVEDNATIFFWQGFVLPYRIWRLLCLFSYETVSSRENSLKICKTVRNEEPTVRPWERQWNRVTHGETVRVERSVIPDWNFKSKRKNFSILIWSEISLIAKNLALPKMLSHFQSHQPIKS